MTLTIDSLTRSIAIELIDRIAVSQVYTVDGEKNLDIAISYKFSPIGVKPIPDNKKRAC